MTTSILNDHDHHADEPNDKVIYGFWVYIMTDCIMFAALFATYVVLHPNTYGSIGIAQVARLPYIFVQTLLLLSAGFTYGLCLLGMHQQNLKKMQFWLGITFLLSLGFLGLGYHELAHLVQNGYTWQTSAFLSSFFTLIVIHGLHVFIALIWMLILALQLKMKGINGMMKTRFACLGLFVDFINLMWIIIFTIVYLMGAI